MLLSQLVFSFFLCHTHSHCFLEAYDIIASKIYFFSIIPVICLCPELCLCILSSLIFLSSYWPNDLSCYSDQVSVYTLSLVCIILDFSPINIKCYQFYLSESNYLNPKVNVNSIWISHLLLYQSRRKLSVGKIFCSHPHLALLFPLNISIQRR